MAPASRAASAPGKVLLAGGYLVLDRNHTGLVFGLDARIHVRVQPLTTSSGVALEEISVRSPQFKDAHWDYGYRLTESDGGIKVTQLRAGATLELHANPFVETALNYALTYITTIASPDIQPASITILADNDYYSKPTAHGHEIPQTSERFLDFNVPLWEAHKTGLGSSAALVTAFTAAVLVHYLPEDIFTLSTDTGRRRLHNLAQAAHCAAQGKVGSGFDVASAVYGSCLYRRFSPSLLTSHGEPGIPGFAKTLKALVEETDAKTTWDTQISKSAVSVPRGLRLVMCDVDCGSQTPGMVKKVLAWRHQHPEVAGKLWDSLQSSNDALAAELVSLAQSQSSDYAQLRECISAIRALIREMSRRSDVPIEPPAQTRLLDRLSVLRHVVGGVVPGAGGYDAVALLIEDKPEALEELQQALTDWNETKAKVDSSGEDAIGKVSTLGVREEMDGVRLENAAGYEHWVM